MNIIIVVWVFIIEFSERISYLFEESRGLPTDPRVFTFEHFDSPRVNILTHCVIPIDSLVLFHHQDFRIHLGFFEGIASHFSLEFCCRHWVDTLDVLEGGIDFLIFHFSLILHEIVRLLMQEFEPSKKHVQLLLG